VLVGPGSRCRPDRLVPVHPSADDLATPVVLGGGHVRPRADHAVQDVMGRRRSSLLRCPPQLVASPRLRPEV